jgi:hypothetical protein
VRSTAKCLKCGDPREIVSHGLCAKCLMQNRRAEEKAGDPSWTAGPDRSQRREQRDLNKMGANFFKMLVMLSETPISNLVVTDEEFEAVKSRIVTWIGRIYAMQKVPDTRGPTIQSSKNGKPKLTVIPESELPVNTESEQVPA